MNELINALITWSNDVNAHEMPKWESLPDIDLYMDQVITYMEKQMNVFVNSDDDKIITPSMINNYVKYKQIPSPIKKKYSKEHLGYLLTICMLKQVLPINDISDLISTQRDKMEMSELYNSFCEVQDEALKAMTDRVQAAVSSADTSENQYEDALSKLAIKLATEANASRIAAEKILNILERKKQEANEQKNKK